ncbi:unnamed protein product, partial [Musa acuminata var. zebrina]
AAVVLVTALPSAARLTRPAVAVVTPAIAPSTDCVIRVESSLSNVMIRACKQPSVDLRVQLKRQVFFFLRHSASTALRLVAGRACSSAGDVPRQDVGQKDRRTQQEQVWPAH